MKRSPIIEKLSTELTPHLQAIKFFCLHIEGWQRKFTLFASKYTIKSNLIPTEGERINARCSSIQQWLQRYTRKFAESSPDGNCHSLKWQNRPHFSCFIWGKKMLATLQKMACGAERYDRQGKLQPLHNGSKMTDRVSGRNFYAKLNLRETLKLLEY